MDKQTDLTNFWLGWKATCAIRDCMNKDKLISKCNEKIARQEAAEAFKRVINDADSVTKLANEVVKSTNAEFVSKLNYFSNGGRRSSIYGDEVAAWKEHCGSAFEIVEGELYGKDTINGQPFKSYLFEQIGTRKGNLSGNLFGYIKFMIRSIARNSFGHEEGLVEREDDEGEKLDADVGSTADRSDVYSRSPELNQEIKEVEKFFSEYIDELAGEWDKDYWISLYAGLNKMPINNPDVRALCKRSKSALADVSREAMGNLLLALRGRFSDRAIGGALGGGMQTVLEKKIGNMDFFPALEGVWQKLYGVSGK